MLTCPLAASPHSWPNSATKAPSWADDHILVTPEAQERICASEVWHHFGGFSDEGDSYETQETQFQEELDRFWMRLVGPDERRRRQILACFEDMESNWNAAHITPDGTVRIAFADGSEKSLVPPTTDLPRIG